MTIRRSKLIHLPFGAKAIQEQHKENTDGKCLIVTAIRSPATWFASKYLESTGGYKRDEWLTKDSPLRGFKIFILKITTLQALHCAIPDLLNEFSGGSLKEQFKIMDSNDSYSVLGPAPHDFPVAGYSLLFLRMEESDQWLTIFKKFDPTIEFKRGASRVDQCRELT